MHINEFIQVRITQEQVATLAGQAIIKYSLKSQNDFQIDVLNYGGIICGIWTHDKHGDLDNVVLAYDNFEDYVENIGYFGAIVGRHAGRIGNGKFAIDGVEYQLAINHNSNNLHGGLRGLDKRVWQVNVLDNGIQLYYHSPSLEEGFPGSINFSVSYQITAQNTLKISTYAVPDQKTLINLTNHSSFNLSGGSCLASSQQLQINADSYCPINSSGLIVGSIQPVGDTPFDFRSVKAINRDIASDNSQLKLANYGYDHPFILNKTADSAAKLIDVTSGRVLVVKTSEPALVFYSGSSLAPGGERSHSKYAQKQSGICLETQNIPNAVNLPDWPHTSLYTADKPYSSVTEWQFGVV